MLNITIVCVLYKCALADSLAYNSIIDCARKLTEKFNIKLVLYDNSPSSQTYDADLSSNVQIIYSCNGINDGLAKGYNFACKIAGESGHKWMITMDQDTVLTKEYFDELYDVINTEITTDVVAIVPKITTANGGIGSPAIYNDFNHRKIVNRDAYGAMEKLDAINSAAVIRLSYLAEIGGYNLLFPLDFLDIWFFNVVRKSKMKVLVLNSEILQDFAFDNFSEVSEFRKKSLRRAIVYYMKIFETPKVRWGFFLRQIKSLLLAIMTKFNLPKISNNFKQICLLIFTTKHKIIKELKSLEKEK